MLLLYFREERSRTGCAPTNAENKVIRDSLLCLALTSLPTAASGSAAVALLDCGDGSIVELSAGASRPGASRPPHAAAAAKPALATRDAVAAAAWLRANRVRVIGQPQRIAEGRGASRTVVTFLTPWGQPLQLVSHTSAGEAAARITASGLAAQ